MAIKYGQPGSSMAGVMAMVRCCSSGSGLGQEGRHPSVMFFCSLHLHPLSLTEDDGWMADACEAEQCRSDWQKQPRAPLSGSDQRHVL